MVCLFECFVYEYELKILSNLGYFLTAKAFHKDLFMIYSLKLLGELKMCPCFFKDLFLNYPFCTV